MANPSKESIITRIAVAILCMLFSVMWGWYRGQQFLDVVDHIIASFGGLVPGAVLAWIIWQTTQSTKVPEEFGVFAIKNIEKVGYYKSNFLIKLCLEPNTLSFDASSLVVPVLDRGARCNALGIGDDNPPWREKVNFEYWQLGNQQAVYYPGSQNTNRPSLLIYQSTVETYGYICEVKDSYHKLNDIHVFKYAVNSVRIEANLPLDWNLRVIRSGIDEEITTISHNGMKVANPSTADNSGNARKLCVCCIQEVIPNGSELEWVITNTTKDF